MQLRKEGYSYRKIQDELGCSKSTISYHCGEGQKDKTRKRMQERRKDHPCIQKVDTFKHTKPGSPVKKKKPTCAKDLQNKANTFQRPNNSRRPKADETTFTYHDVLEKYENDPTCYLTGRK